LSVPVSSNGHDPEDPSFPSDIPRKSENQPYLCHTNWRIVFVFRSSAVLTALMVVQRNQMEVNAEMMNQSQPYPNRDFAIDYDLMNFINDTVKSAIKDAVQDTVDKELSLMVNGEAFQKRINGMIDAQLRSLIQEIAVKTSGAGPGRGTRAEATGKSA
jgi:hypothetical protein